MLGHPTMKKTTRRPYRCSLRWPWIKMLIVGSKQTASVPGSRNASIVRPFKARQRFLRLISQSSPRADAAWAFDKYLPGHQKPLSAVMRFAPIKALKLERLNGAPYAHRETHNPANCITNRLGNCVRSNRQLSVDVCEKPYEYKNP